MIAVALNSLFGAVVFLHCLRRLNCMDADTNHAIRVAFVGLAIGGFMAAAAPLFERCAPQAVELVINGSLAAFCLADRRGRCHHAAWESKNSPLRG